MDVDIFLPVALVAEFYGSWGLEALAIWSAKVLFFVFLLLFVLSLEQAASQKSRSIA